MTKSPPKIDMPSHDDAHEPTVAAAADLPTVAKLMEEFDITRVYLYYVFRHAGIAPAGENGRIGFYPADTASRIRAWMARGQDQKRKAGPKRRHSAAGIVTLALERFRNLHPAINETTVSSKHAELERTVKAALAGIAPIRRVAGRDVYTEVDAERVIGEVLK